ncbi:MAG: hypothetical protein CMJ40_09455 [Phycisphaerae bacterium]|nr:hypothetical protein [Phycisphaerae bacterium]
MPPLPDYPEALEAATAPAWNRTPVFEVDLPDAHDHVLAEPLVADRDLPPFNRSAMDGYAIRHKDLASDTTVPCTGFIAAGSTEATSTPEGSCIRIATGAPVPADLDTVIPHELSDRGSPVTFTTVVEQGNAIHRRGSDAEAGDVLCAAGTKLRSVELGLAAMTGRASLRVHQPARIAIVSSGDEIVPVESKPEDHQVRNSNLTMIRDLVQRMGGVVVSECWVPDEPEQTMAAITNDDVDMIITIGGISAGERDAFRDPIESIATISPVRGVAMQPGRPVWVTGTGDQNRLRPIISLPGNPVSALSTCCLFVWPIMRMLHGMSAQLPWTIGRLGSEAQRNPIRRRFRPACLDSDGTLHIPRWQGSGDLVHAARSAGLMDIDSGTEPVSGGTPVRWLPWP